VVTALRRGYEFAMARPSQAAAYLERAVSGLDPRLVRADLNALQAAFAPAHGSPGRLDVTTLRAWAAWEARFHLVAHPPEVARMFDTRFTR
jgi:hypothetical protein